MHKLYDFIEARERLTTVVVKTKLMHSPVFSEESGNEIYLKPENLQKTGSFKIRGAYNKIAKLTEEEKKKGVIASSAGNHAQGVAYAAKRLGIKAVIVMPKHTPLIKVEATRKYGAEVVLHGEVYDDAYKKALELQKENGYIFVHPFNDEDVIEGQGVSGISSAAKLKNPQVKVIGVEPEGAASAIAALEKGKVVELAEANTIADGTAVKRIGEKNFEYIKKYVDDIVTVSDYELMEAFLLLVEKHKLVAENSGILPVAAAKKLNIKGKKIVAVVSGGNIDVLTISSMINKGLIMRGRIFTFSVQLADKPGQLLKVSEILAKQNANVIKLEHNQFKNLSRFKDVELQVTVETNGEEHIYKIAEAFKKEGYEIVRENSPM